MFEKEAKEYTHTKHCEKCSTGHCEKKCILVKDDYEAFKDGAEFGYNKAKVEAEESYRESLCNSELNLASVTEQLEELKKENAELTCQMKRNTYCYSCKNAVQRCFKKEIGCPCGKYESYRDRNEKDLIFGAWHKHNDYAKTIIKDLLSNSDEYARQRAMAFLRE